jgi:hypothetical protein
MRFDAHSVVFTAEASLDAINRSDYFAASPVGAIAPHGRAGVAC